METKFALYNFSGKPVGYYLVEEEPLAREEISDAPDVTHHIIVVDRSGSMWGEMDDLKETILKLLTLEEYEDAEMKVSLISYSSQGDTTLHFQNVKVGDIMKKNSPYQKKIKELRVTGLTCISQALFEANDIIDDNDITAITLHSDGYANDRSPTSEAREIKRACDLLAKRDVFVNTLAYTPWSDFKTLSGISNALSGQCIQANNIKVVFDAMHETSTMLTEHVAPAIEVPLGDADFQIFLSQEGKKVIGAANDMKVRGINPEHDGFIYRFKEVSEKEYNASSAHDCTTEDYIEASFPVIAFSRACLSLGMLNKAKYALVSIKNKTMLEAHARALSNDQYVAFAQDLEAALFQNSMKDHYFTDEPGLESDSISILELAGLIKENASAIELNQRALLDGYTRRSVRRIPGKIDDKGNFHELELKTEVTQEGDFIQISSVEINRTNATINLQVVLPIDLVRVRGKKKEVIDEVAGVDLSELQTFRNYTIVGDGILNVSELKLKFHSKKAFRVFEKVDVVAGEYDPETEYTIDLRKLPLVRYDSKFDAIDGLFDKLAGMRVLSSILAGCLKERSDALTDKQIEALKEVYVTPSLNVSFPTVYEYQAKGMTKEEALNEGVIDTRLSYKVQFGTEDVLNLSKVPSANKFLGSFYTQKLGTDDVAKPTFELFLEDETSFDFKKLSARKKITKVDDMLKPIFDDFLGLDDTGAITDILDANGLSDLKDGFAKIADRKWESVDEAVEILTDARKKLDRSIAKIFREQICPLVFYIGATGLIPDEFDTNALTKDDLQDQFPGLKLGKTEDDASFFVVGDTILSVYAKTEHFTR